MLTSDLFENKRTQAQRSAEKCWPGKVKKGTKPSPTHPGVRVNNCVPKGSVNESSNAAWRAGYERGLKYYRQGPANPYEPGTPEAKDYADGYHNGELDSHEKYGSSMDEGVSEAIDPARNKLQQLIYKYFNQIYDYGDDGLNYMENNSEVWNELMDKYNGEIADIVAHEPTPVLMQAAQELKGIAGDLKYELDEQGVAEGYWQDAVKKAEASREARKGKPFEKNPASHDKQDVYKGDKDLAGKLVPKRKQQDVSEGITSPEIKQAYNDIFKTAPRTPERKSAVKKYLKLHSDALESKRKEQGVMEVSKDTLDRYVTKAVDAHGHADFSARMSKDDPTKRSYHVDQKKTAEKRRQGISRALDRMSKTEGVAEDDLNEFAAPGSSDGGGDGFSEDTLKRLAAQWYNGDEDRRVESTLMAAGWEIGQDEGYDNGGAFVVQSGDEHGDSYLSWPAEELEGLAEGLNEQELDEAVGTLELADFLFKGLEQKFPKIIQRYGHEVVGNAIMDVAEENQDVDSVSEVDMLIDDIIEKLQNYNGNDSGLAEATVSRLYYNVVGTSAPELRKDFGMRHDRRGWFLSESSGRNRIMDAQRAFGSPKLVEYDLAANNGDAATLGPDNVISPIGTVPKGQRINKKSRK